MNTDNKNFNFLWISAKRKHLALVIFISLLFLDQAVAKNNDFQINYLNITEIEDELRLDAEIDYQLNDEIEEALVNGIALMFQVEVQVKTQRKWTWDKTISEVSHSYSLRYHALSKQYIWENLDTGASDTFPDLESALTHQGRISAMYIAETSNLFEENQHFVQLRSRMLTDKLPLPLRIKSYFSSKWRLTSGWNIWPL